TRLVRLPFPESDNPIILPGFRRMSQPSPVRHPSCMVGVDEQIGARAEETTMTKRKRREASAPTEGMSVKPASSGAARLAKAARPSAASLRRLRQESAQLRAEI